MTKAPMLPGVSNQPTKTSVEKEVDEERQCRFPLPVLCTISELGVGCKWGEALGLRCEWNINSSRIFKASDIRSLVGMLEMVCTRSSHQWGDSFHWWSREKMLIKYLLYFLISTFVWVTGRTLCDSCTVCWNGEISKWFILFFYN